MFFLKIFLIGSRKQFGYDKNTMNNVDKTCSSCYFPQNLS